MDEQAALGWFQNLGYAVLRSLQLAPWATGSGAGDIKGYGAGGPAARDHWRLNSPNSEAPQATVAQPATVQSSSWLNP